jgi:hypothetical protein
MRFQNAPVRASSACPLALGFSHQHHTTWADRHGLQSTRRVAPGPLGASPCGHLLNDVVAGAMTTHVQSRSKAFNFSRSMATNPLPPLNAFERLGNANYSSPQCQLEITSGPVLVWVDVVGSVRPLRRNGVLGAVGDKDAVEPKGAGPRFQPPLLSLSRFARRLSPLNSRMIE